MSTETTMSRVAWWVAVASLLLGPVVAVVGIGLGFAAKRRGGEWEPTVALGTMVMCMGLALVAAAIGMS